MSSKFTFRFTKPFYFFIFVLCFVFFANAKPLTQQEENLMEDLTAFRLQFVTTLDRTKAVTQVENYLLSVKNNPAFINASAEMQLVIESILKWEKFNVLQEIDFKDPKAKKIVYDQYYLMREYLDNHKDANKWFYTFFANVVSSVMQYLPLQDAMKEGLSIKKYYETALEEDPNFSCANLYLGEWYYFAPGFAGGSKKKAFELMEKSISCAQNRTDRFYAELVISQAFFDSKKMNEYHMHFEIARQIEPVTRYIHHLEAINELKYSEFYYALNRAKVDSELKSMK